MKVAYKKRFIRDLNKIPVQTRQKIQETVFEQIPNINDFQEIRGLKKIQGFSNFFRLRVSDYIIGISMFSKFSWIQTYQYVIKTNLLYFLKIL